MRHHARTTVASLLVAATLVLLAACGQDDPVADRPNGTVPPTTEAGAAPTAEREVLATEQYPPGAPGTTLTLVRTTIPAGVRLSPHVHPGLQLARIESGVLTYTVIEGSTDITRADGSTEQVTGPATTELHAGDSVSEMEDLVHFGANETDEPVVIISSMLTRDGEDLAVPVSTTSTVPE